MLQTLDEIRNVELESGQVINGIDNPRLMSVDSTEPIKTELDQVKKLEDKKGGSGTSNTETPVKKTEETKDETDDKKNKQPEEKPEKPQETKDAVQKRIGDLTKKWRSTERALDYEKQKRQEVEAELKKLKNAIPATDKPKRDDFEDDEAYLEALTDWNVDNKLRQSQESNSKTTEENEEKTAIDETWNAIDEMIATGRGKYPDFEEVAMDKTYDVSEHMAEIILDSDISADIMYYLGQNRDESAEIAKMSPLKAAKEIGKIEAELIASVKKELDKEEQPPPSKKKTTNAPEPIVPPKASGVIEKDPSNMSPKEYRAWREKK